MSVDHGTSHAHPPTNVRQALLQAVRLLADAGVPSSRLDAEVLLAHVLGWRRARLYAWPEQLLTAEELQLFFATVERRCAREPVPYITGHRPFYGLDFGVDPRVLIPRPETELLVERALEATALLLAREQRVLVAEVGTGSGIVAVCLAVSLPSCVVVATDVSAGALRVAALNARTRGVANRIHLVHSDLLTFLPLAVGLIVANLPYVPSTELASLTQDVRCYEPLIALDGGPDGLTHIRRLLEQSGRWLLPGGVILLEVGAGQASEVASLASHLLSGARIQRFCDYGGSERVVSVET